MEEGNGRSASERDEIGGVRGDVAVDGDNLVGKRVCIFGWLFFRG